MTQLDNVNGVGIIGQSGVGKTLLAIEASKSLEKKYKILVTDLRNFNTINKLHELVARETFSEAIAKKHQAALINPTLDNLITLCSIKKLLFIIDHGELIDLDSKDHNQILNFFNSIPSESKFILTSRNPTRIHLSYPSFKLEFPEQREIVSMLSCWIITSKKWLIDVANIVGNHPFVINRVGKKSQGTYKIKKQLINSIRDNLYQSNEIYQYFNHYFSTIDKNLMTWMYLGLLNDGVIIKDIIPSRDYYAMKKDELILSEIKEKNIHKITFHPLLVKSLSDFINIEDAAQDIIRRFNRFKTTGVLAYYLFQCSIILADYILSKKIILDYWQEWAEIFGPSKLISILQIQGIGLIEENKKNLFISIVLIYQGDKRSLQSSKNLLFAIQNSNTSNVGIKTLSLIENLECERKANGPLSAYSKMCSKIQLINTGLFELRKAHHSNASNFDIYCLATSYFLIGSLLKTFQKHDQAIKAYQKCIQFIGTNSPGNLSLQKMHAYYCIGDSQLKNGFPDIAITTINNFFSLKQPYSKFGEALMMLLLARSYLTLKSPQKGLQKIRIAKKLFTDLNLPYYYERSLLVSGALNLIKGNTKSAEKTLSSIIATSDGSLSLNLRAKMLLSLIQPSIFISENEIIQLEHTVGSHIASSYCNLLNMKNIAEIDKVSIYNLTIDDNYLLKLEEDTKTDLRNRFYKLNSWMID